MKTTPIYHYCFNLLGACYNTLGQFDPASQFFETAISLKPDYAEAFLNHGIVMREVGKLDHAAKSFKRAIEILPNYFEAHNKLGSYVYRFKSI